MGQFIEGGIVFRCDLIPQDEAKYYLWWHTVCNAPAHGEADGWFTKFKEVREARGRCRKLIGRSLLPSGL